MSLRKNCLRLGNNIGGVLQNLLKISLLTVFSSGTSSASPMRFDYFKSMVLSTEKKFQDTKIGGLSGIAKMGEMYWAVSDDRGTYGNPRLYGFEMTLNSSSFEVIPKKMLTLKNKASNLIGSGALDLEAIVVNANSIYLANEGIFDQKPRVMPSILEFNWVGELKSSIKIPEAYLPESKGKQKKGVHSNGSFEGMSLSPSGKYLWVSVEQPLMQDEPRWKMGDPGSVRLMRFKTSKSGWTRDSEWKYPLEPTLNSESKGNIVLGQGISEIMALSDSEILVLERSTHTSGTQVFQELRLFQTSLESSKDKAPLQVLSKQLVFNFSQVSSKIVDGKGLDNLEGMTWGPEINGKRTLLFVSDDNFNPLQRTIWLALIEK